MDELKADIKEIKGHVIELVAQGAVHNEILKQHEARSTALETRFVPVERHYYFLQKLFAVTVAVGTLAAAILRLFR